MTTIHPCRLCPLREGCEQRDEFRRRVRGIGLRVASFPCPTLAAEVRVGRRIVINQPILVDGNPDVAWGEEITAVVRQDMPATITYAYPDYSFTCTVDREAFEAVADQVQEEADAWMKKRFRRQQKHFRIVRFLDEPDWTVCQSGNVGSISSCDTRDRCECKELADQMADAWRAS